MLCTCIYVKYIVQVIGIPCSEEQLKMALFTKSHFSVYGYVTGATILCLNCDKFPDPINQVVVL